MGALAAGFGERGGGRLEDEDGLEGGVEAEGLQDRVGGEEREEGAVGEDGGD